ncbi:MAG: hypothetical protein Q9184_004417 [Pyrenodesmia sp. 2 TL-2023]
MANPRERQLAATEGTYEGSAYQAPEGQQPQHAPASLRQNVSKLKRNLKRPPMVPPCFLRSLLSYHCRALPDFGTNRPLPPTSPGSSAHQPVTQHSTTALSEFRRPPAGTDRLQGLHCRSEGLLSTSSKAGKPKPSRRWEQVILSH